MFLKLWIKVKAYWGYIALGAALLLAIFRSKKKVVTHQPMNPAAPLIDKAEERVEAAADKIEAVLDAAPDLDRVEDKAKEQAAKEHEVVAASTNPYGTV